MCLFSAKGLSFRCSNTFLDEVLNSAPILNFWFYSYLITWNLGYEAQIGQPLSPASVTSKKDSLDDDGYLFVPYYLLK